MSSRLPRLRSFSAGVLAFAVPAALAVAVAAPAASARTHGHDNEFTQTNLISDLTTGDFGGYQATLAIHAEGSLEAEKLTILREYDRERVKHYARWVAGL